MHPNASRGLRNARTVRADPMQTDLRVRVTQTPVRKTAKPARAKTAFAVMADKCVAPIARPSEQAEIAPHTLTASRLSQDGPVVIRGAGGRWDRHRKGIAAIVPKDRKRTLVVVSKVRGLVRRGGDRE